MRCGAAAPRVWRCRRREADTSPDRYAVFVWPAYGATALGFAWMVVDTLLRARGWRRRVKRLEDEPSK